MDILCIQSQSVAFVGDPNNFPDLGGARDDDDDPV